MTGLTGRTFVFVLLFTFSHPFLAGPEAPALPAVRTYDELLRAIRETRAASRVRIEQAVERERIRAAWETGRLIQEHILLNKERADYGAKVVQRLSRDLGIGYSELKYMREFARTYPIGLPGGQLSWAHYKALLAVNDDEKRKEMAARAEKENWSRNTLRREIGKLRAAHAGPSGAFPGRELLTPLQGELSTYRVVNAPAGEWKGKPVLDLGFSNYYRPPGKFNFKEGDIVGVSKGKPKLLRLATESLVPFQVFSYRAYVLDVTDGDTLWALVDLGFHFTTKQQLRLRGIDAPEITAGDGREAKAFLESLLADSAPVTVTTVKSDKYDRYLIDLRSGETYVNQKLLDEGLAVRAGE